MTGTITVSTSKGFTGAAVFALGGENIMRLDEPLEAGASEEKVLMLFLDLGVSGFLDEGETGGGRSLEEAVG